jgi:hypothetical protein
VACNFSPEPVRFPPPEDFAGNSLDPPKVLIGNIRDSDYIRSSTLSPFEAVALYRKNNIFGG